MQFMSKKRRYPTLKNIRQAIKNRSGSEALKMVYSTATLCVLILCALMILGYALQVNAVAYAGKRVARYVEVSGTANQEDLNILLKELLRNHGELDAKVYLTDVTYFNISQKKIHLREPFTVNIEAKYRVTLLAPGGNRQVQFAVPIHVKVNGQSETYWK